VSDFAAENRLYKESAHRGAAGVSQYPCAQALVSNKAERDFIEARIIEMRRNGSITEPRSGS
jgi:hypothetical protein